MYLGCASRQGVFTGGAGLLNPSFPSNVMVKYVPEVSSWQLLFVRCSMQLLTMLPLVYLSGQNIMGTPDWATRWRVVAQGILGGFLLLTIFEAVSRMPLGDCTAIFFSSPAFTMVLSFIILKCWSYLGLLLSSPVFPCPLAMFLSTT